MIRQAISYDCRPEIEENWWEIDKAWDIKENSYFVKWEEEDFWEESYEESGVDKKYICIEENRRGKGGRDKVEA